MICKHVLETNIFKALFANQDEQRRYSAYKATFPHDANEWACGTHIMNMKLIK
jgi:hypothetical protein